MSKRVAVIGIFIALAMIFSYIEVLIPFSLGIPGVKLGVANIVVVTGLYMLKPQEVFFISILRIMLIGLLFGNVMTLSYSLAGGMLSFVVMYLFKKIDSFSVIGVSAAGGVFHNLGQIIVAAFILKNEKILYYFPVLIIAGVVTGILIGFVSDKVIKTLKIQDFSGNLK